MQFWLRSKIWLLAPSPCCVLWAAPLERVRYLPQSTHTLPLWTPEKWYSEVSGRGELCRRHIRAEQSSPMETHCSHRPSKHLPRTIEPNIRQMKQNPGSNTHTNKSTRLQPSNGLLCPPSSPKTNHQNLPIRRFVFRPLTPSPRP